ncbi:MAG: ferredoxin thioredoxin reductase catalytic beta chain [Clostridia bacterium]|nr:ferredoxin thioredoxin reductase catalytic beta chain [Clostridia bacterium]
MAVKLNEDKALVAKIKEGLKARGGYCPCRIAKTEDYKCICKEFREQIADESFEGYCHCMLYYKTKD